ncbi:MAG: hypothetical protein ACN6O7_22045 [Sphingobacterium sp.]
MARVLVIALGLTVGKEFILDFDQVVFAGTCTTPLWEDDLLSIDDALLLVGTESVQDDWIVLVKKKRGK